MELHLYTEDFDEVIGKVNDLVLIERPYQSMIVVTPQFVSSVVSNLHFVF